MATYAHSMAPQSRRRVVMPRLDRLLRTVWAPPAVLLNIACFLAGRAGLLGGARPFGVALFFMVLRTGDRVQAGVTALCVLAGMATVTEGARVLATGAALAVALICLSRSGKGAGGEEIGETAAWRDALLLAALLTAARLLQGWSSGLTDRLVAGITLETVMVILVAVLLLPLARVLRGGMPERLHSEQLVSVGLAAVVVGLGLQGWQVGMVSPAEVWNRWVVLIAAYLGRGAIGAAQGTALGLLADISASGPSGGGAGLYGISGLLGGLFNNRGKVGVVGGFLLGNMIASVQAATGEEIVLGFLHSGLAVLLFVFTPWHLIRQVERAIPGTEAAVQIAAGREERLRSLAAQRLEQMADVFAELSGIFTRGATGRTPLEKGATAETRQLAESREIVPRQLAGVADIVRSIAGQLQLDTKAADEIEIRVSEELTRRHIPYTELRVLYAGGEHPQVSMCLSGACDGQSRCARLAAQAVTAALVEPYTPWQVECRGAAGKCRVHLLPERPFDVIVRAATVAKDESGVSGDTCAKAELADGKVAVLLSDGMGAGPLAAIESSATVAMLQRLISAGFDRRFAVQTVNSVLLLRSPEETYATLDLAVIDMFSGELEFLKTGSVPSFIRHGPEVEIVRTSSLPIGILSQIEVPVRYRLLRPGDLLVMVTDGVLDALPNVYDKEEWFARMLRRADCDEAADLADRLLRTVWEMTGKSGDDMTVVVVKLLQRSKGGELFGKEDLPAFRRQVSGAAGGK